jgi:hypothetical protein
VVSRIRVVNFFLTAFSLSRLTLDLEIYFIVSSSLLKAWEERETETLHACAGQGETMYHRSPRLCG